METNQQTIELQKFNVTDAWIEQARKDYMSLKVAGIEDKAGFQAVREARLIIKRKRVEVEKVAKILNEDAIKWQRTVNAEKKRIIDQLSPIEDHLQFEEDKIDVEKERIRKEEEQKATERFNNRVFALIASGCVFDGVSYNIGTLTIDNPRLKMIEDEAFYSLLSSVKEQKAKDDEAKAELERQRKAEEERLQREREELERLRQEQEKIQKEQREKEAALKAEQDRLAAEAKLLQEKKTKGRCDELFALGLNFNGSSYILKDESGYIDVPHLDIITKADTEWSDLIEKIKPVICDIKDTRSQREEADRQAAIKAAEEKARLEGEARAKREQEEAAAKEAAETAETARLEALRPDKEKLTKYANEGLQAVIDSMPDVSSEQATAILSDAKMLIGKIRSHILSKVNSL